MRHRYGCAVRGGSFLTRGLTLVTHMNWLGGNWLATRCRGMRNPVRLCLCSVARVQQPSSASTQVEGARGRHPAQPHSAAFSTWMFNLLCTCLLYISFCVVISPACHECTTAMHAQNLAPSRQGALMSEWIMMLEGLIVAAPSCTASGRCWG